MQRSTALLLTALCACLPDIDKPDDDTGTDTQETAAPLCSWYADEDGDGYGDPDAELEAPCDSQPSSSVEDATDCDDGEAEVHPGAEEICDGLDNDCDESTDENEDVDGDGVGPCDGDCDDGDAEVYPGAEEICDGLDNDCDESTDETVDGDGDGLSVCDGDCDDTVAQANPSAPEVCDDLDNDCDGEVDEDCVRCTATVPTNFDDIQGAVDGVADGAVICVEPGTWSENLSLGDSSLHLVGLGGPSLVVLEAASDGAVLSIDATLTTELTVEGFTITPGAASTGRGVSIVDASPTLRNLVISGHTTASSGKGGGILVNGGSPWLVDVEVSDNTADHHGGGIYLQDTDALLEDVRVLRNQVTDSSGRTGGGLGLEGASPTLVNVLVQGNYAPTGGGLSISGSSAPLLQNCTIRGNEAGDAGGGLRASGGQLGLENVLVIGNEAGSGGGLHLQSVDAELRNVLVGANHARNGGGGAYLGGGAVDLEQTVLAANQSEGDAGGIYLVNYVNLDMVNSIVHANTAAASGGGIYGNVTATQPDVERCSFTDNEPDDTAGIDPLEPGENIATAPSFLALEGDDAWDWDLHLDIGSGLVDQGSDELRDPDGGPSDLGLYGGEGAAAWDIDGDGFYEYWQPGPYDSDTYPYDSLDCDDRDDELYPGAGCEEAR